MTCATSRTPNAEGAAVTGGSQTKNSCLESDGAYVLRFVAFPTLANLEFDPLTFLEGFEPVAIDIRKMDEDIFAVFARDEAETLLAVEELHGA